MSDFSNPQSDDVFTWKEKTNDYDDSDYYAESREGEAKPKLDIFDELRNADLNNYNFYSKLTPDLQKQFSPFVAMRWFSGAQDNSPLQAWCLVLVNELVNVHYSVFTKNHPELMWKLMAACGPGKSLKRTYIAPAKGRKKITKVQEFLLEWYPDANDDELDILTNSMDREGFENFIKSTGATDAELDELLAAHDKQTGFIPEKVAKGKKRKAKD
jgi:hypothetical protein